MSKQKVLVGKRFYNKKGGVIIFDMLFSMTLLKPALSCLVLIFGPAISLLKSIPSNDTNLEKVCGCFQAFEHCPHALHGQRQDFCLLSEASGSFFISLFLL